MTLHELSLDNIGVSQEMAFTSWQSLHQLSEHIFEICKTLQLLRPSGNTQTDTQTDYYNLPLHLCLG